MTRCHCEYSGNLETKEHRDHHRQWEQERAVEPPDRATASQLELAGWVAQAHLFAAWESRFGPLPLSAQQRDQIEYLQRYTGVKR